MLGNTKTQLLIYMYSHEWIISIEYLFSLFYNWLYFITISPYIITPNISPPQYPNKGNDRQLKMLLTSQQIFLVRSIGNA